MGYPGGDYDVIVIGTGHAGCEAGLAAARLGCRTLLITMSLDNVALMPCNPAIGGPAKAHLVREIDALGGEMAVNIDKTYIQIRMLNTGKGPAVQALRAQADKKQYQEEMRSVLGRTPNLHLKQGLVDRIVVEGGHVCGVITRTGIEYGARAIVLTTGVYMEGRVIVGDVAYAAGPSGQLAALGLSEALRGLGLELGRFKTGTPPRIDRNTVDFERLIVQPGDDRPLAFSFLSEPEGRRQLPCWLTYTNERTHEIIRRNLHRAPLYTGEIKGTGPRYCPSIEDKIVRFADKTSHQVFLEPEGWRTNEMYVLGLSTSLPEDVQVEVIRTIPGLEHAEIIRPGYAIEYDYLVPTQLKPSLEVRAARGLFSAGQVNGTSGYEEAAAQGIIAGINAAHHVRGEQAFVLGRDEAYIGVLIDDLVNKGTSEPYRMLTSRAEYRLLLRQDNADLRLTEKGWKVGLVTPERYERFRARREAIDAEARRLRRTVVPPAEDSRSALAAMGTPTPGGAVTLAELLRRPEVNYDSLAAVDRERPRVAADVASVVETEIKYEGYIEKQMAQVERFRRLEGRSLPEDLDYEHLGGLSTEGRQKLARMRPLSVGQALRISGVSPADVAVLLAYLEKSGRRREG